MSPPVIFLRPEPGLAETLSKARSCGLNAVGSPLSLVEPLRWKAPDAALFDGLLIGSANAIRHAGRQLSSLTQLPIYAVGQRTAEVAESSGFTVKLTGEGGLQSVLDALAGTRLRLLRLGGEDRISLKPAPEQQIEEMSVYRIQQLELPDSLAIHLQDRAIVALHSASAARHFTNECNRLGVDKGRIRIAALGRRIARAAGYGWGEVAVAPAPNDPSLLAMIENMCQ